MGQPEHFRGLAVPASVLGHRRCSELPRRAQRVCVAQASASAAAPAVSPVAAATELRNWLEAAGFPALEGSLALSPSDRAQGVTLRTSRRFGAGEVLLNIPENFSVTSLDVASHPVLAPAAQAGSSSDIPLLALWLLWESNQGPASPWAPYLSTFGAPPPSPLLWSPAERTALLQGHSGLAAIEQRDAEIEAVFRQFEAALFRPRAAEFPAAQFSLGAFKAAFVHVLSRAVFLPGADVFALLPLADLARHSPSSRAFFQYNAESASVVLTSDRALEAGEEVLISRGPELGSLDLALQSGEAGDANPYDCITYTASLVPTDPLYLVKKQLLMEEGLDESVTFPLFADKFPRQLLSYLRLARLQDSAQFVKVTFKADMVVSESNEYEVLMLLLGECKERMMAFQQTLEDDLRVVRGRTSGPGLLQSLGVGNARDESSEQEDARKEKLAAQLRVSEKTILANTITALRNRLAPIRGIPTKSGMGDPNLEIKEVFALMETGFSAPKKLLGDLFGKDKR